MALGGRVDVLATEDPDVAREEEEEELQVYEKHNHLLHGNRRQRYAMLKSAPPKKTQKNIERK